MDSYNCVILAGNLTRDPQVRTFDSGGQVCTLGLAVNRRWRSQTGEDREEVCFVDIDVFGRQAEMCQQYLSKGRNVLVEGHLHLDQWQDRETGANRSRLKVVAQRVQFLDSRGSEQAGQASSGQGYGQAAPSWGNDQPSPTQESTPDVPF